MKKMKKVLTLLLAVIVFTNTNLIAYASSKTVIPSTDTHSKSIGNIIVTNQGIYINDVYYTQEEFIQLLDSAQKEEVANTNALPLIIAAGTWLIPTVGTVVVTAAGLILLDGVEVKNNTWVYKAVIEWFKSKADGNNKKSGKPYKNNKEANKQAQKHGYKDAHDLKEAYVGKDLAKYDMKYDTKTGEIYLESKNGKIQVPTGLYNK
ncbi:hypothetical protein [Lacrimispora sp. JR3]|uniref:hypothetical protein n=1 Tax=Lacrimispora sinapis TaxID=3111456 RepID=UPI003747C784